LRPDVEEETRKLAMRKLADKYIGRHGEPPSLFSRRAAGKQQDVNDDDRKHLKWCLDAIERGITRGKIEQFADAKAALDFVSALLERDYNLYPERKLYGTDRDVRPRK
jgi:hypothetical protein